MMISRSHEFFERLGQQISEFEENRMSFCELIKKGQAMDMDKMYQLLQHYKMMEQIKELIPSHLRSDDFIPRINKEFDLMSS
mmetsp:Transcript_27282/g.24078  ORF Transcript_27282/g.24078 Transcript_27282/m.24078 type:complete len:82 (+) Transcript_27282:261-506(+)